MDGVCIDSVRGADFRMHQRGRRRDLEIFEAGALSWWDRAGPMAGLHLLNPIRSDYFRERLERAGARCVLELGCGGGILTSSLEDKPWRLFAKDLLEWVFRYIPVGTHRFRDFILPEELHSLMEGCGIRNIEIYGIIPERGVLRSLMARSAHPFRLDPRRLAGIYLGCGRLETPVSSPGAFPLWCEEGLRLPCSPRASRTIRGRE